MCEHSGQMILAKLREGARERILAWAPLHAPGLTLLVHASVGRVHGP